MGAKRARHIFLLTEGAKRASLLFLLKKKAGTFAKKEGPVLRAALPGGLPGEN